MNHHALGAEAERIKDRLKELKKVEPDTKAKKRGKRRLMKEIKKAGWQK
jgi:hypothetical protein